MPEVIVISGTRSEAIKLFPVIRALAAIPRPQRPHLRHRTTPRAARSGAGIAHLAPDIDLDLMEPRQTLDRLTARLLVGLGDVMDAERPDLVIVQSDTAT